jgi:hypothetical protein
MNVELTTPILTRSSVNEPQYWNLLSEEDKASYIQLKNGFLMNAPSRSRNNTVDNFDGMLESIRQFAERDNEDDWRRFLVCGLCWMPNALAINTRQLRLLVSKCKSSINGSLQKLGYTTDMSHSESWKGLFPHIPMLKDHFRELRQWTIRYKTEAPAPPQTFVPIPLKKSDIAPSAKQVIVEPPKPLPIPEETKPEETKTPTWPIKFRARLNRKAPI